MTTRAEIVAAARGWIGTPYRHQASTKGAGCDCLGLLRGVWREVLGPEPETPPAYSAGWAEAPGAMPMEAMAEAARRHMSEIAPGDAREGDALLFRMRRNGPAKHVAIQTDGDRMIHAWSGHAVVETCLGKWWRARIAHAFRFPGVED
ncbi:NlpC/P60 family protein [Parvibaculum sp.]|jgi:NlpC/P60 family putative phage cell wall peptidase|uniref:NlpC/P60 family protein n=1 Tax=Parvibaculum sp. TaxID=2024848 RepID=UPI001B128116|nr:NlpC/P60 family protein [Parvibaculum sp.]MBO6635413.1 C40 family peptidase [Parvibaculum sp.]MBO6678647.1 C40 family peptidase [Parvibaculum sp.]MBO6906004.1 C40 family peptidase [Parvibaculum sp.]